MALLVQGTKGKRREMKSLFQILIYQQIAKGRVINNSAFLVFTDKELQSQILQLVS